MPPAFSFIVPFHRGLRTLDRCLDALMPLPSGSELIVAADGAVEDCSPLASTRGLRVVDVPGPSGPAIARNAGAAAATGDVLVFVDADVAVSRAGLRRLARVFTEQPRIAAVFGAYDEAPSDPGFMSQYRNLSHSFVHHASTADAHTFWAGFGAVRRDAFCAVGGFDGRFERPSVEDIDFGYRLTAAGYRVLLDPSLSATHMKRWTVRSAIASDVRDRGVPWTQLIWRYGALRNDLNLRGEYRWSVVLAYLALLMVALAVYDRRALAVLPLVAAGLTVLNHRYYRFFYLRRGAWFAARVWVLHAVQHLCNGVSFAAGTALFVAARYLGVRLPGALATDAWRGPSSDLWGAKAPAGRSA